MLGVFYLFSPLVCWPLCTGESSPARAFGRGPTRTTRAASMCRGRFLWRPWSHVPSSFSFSYDSPWYVWSLVGYPHYLGKTTNKTTDSWGVLEVFIFWLFWVLLLASASMRRLFGAQESGSGGFSCFLMTSENRNFNKLKFSWAKWISIRLLMII